MVLCEALSNYIFTRVHSLLYYVVLVVFTFSSFSFLTGDVSIHFEFAKCDKVAGLALTGLGAANFTGTLYTC